MSQGAAGNVRKRIVEPRLQVGDGMGEGTQLIAVQQPGVLSSDVATQGVRAAGLIVPPPQRAQGRRPAEFPKPQRKIKVIKGVRLLP